MQGRGLIHADSGDYHVASQFQTTDAGGQSAATGSANSGLDVSASTSDQSAVSVVDSHLDSFFQSHALTREDVLVLAAVVQLLAWTALLYLEVRN